jgi:hypothetical protein
MEEFIKEYNLDIQFWMRKYIKKWLIFVKKSEAI